MASSIEWLIQAATKGFLDSIDPNEVLTNLHVRTTNNLWSVLELAAKHGHLDQMPKAALTTANLCNHTNTYNKSPLYYAAEAGFLHQVPKDVLDDATYDSQGFKQQSILHFAAKKGQINLFPAERLTPTVVLATDANGRSALHNAAIEHHLDQFPPAVITAQNLAMEDVTGWTPLLLAAGCGALNQIPTEILTEAELTKSFRGQTAISLAQQNGYIDQLLGIPISENCKSIVGQKWLNKNNAFIKARQEEMDRISTMQNDTDLDIF